MAICPFAKITSLQYPVSIHPLQHPRAPTYEVMSILPETPRLIETWLVSVKRNSFATRYLFSTFATMRGLSTQRRYVAVSYAVRYWIGMGAFLLRSKKESDRK